MEIDPDGTGDKFWSHLAFVKTIQGDRVTVGTDDVQVVVEVPLKDLQKMNDPISFTTSILGNIELEDGFECDYTSTNAQLKFLQIAVALQSVVERLDFNDPSCLDV